MNNNINILLLGITGDLSKLKILPAIGQLAKLQNQTHKIKLYGQSRSEANKDLIIEKINQTSNDCYNDLELKLIQKSYTDSSALTQVIDQTDTIDRLIIYFALPPSVIIDYLTMIDKLDGQIFANKSVDLLLEKPFGRNLLEAKNIIELIERVSKKVKVSFIDHYLFKNQAQIVDQAQIAKLFNTNLIEPSIINIVTLETVDVDNRLGYYIDSGAIDDMTPHLLSLLLKFLKLFEIDDFEININEVAIGQYEGLIDKIKEIDETKLNLETFFEVKADLINGSKLIDLKLTSGKKLLKKKTELEAFLSNNGQFVWDISGNDQIIYTKDGNSTIINTEQNEKLDHVNMFLQVMKKDYSNFITNKQVIMGHNLITKIKEFAEFNNIKVEIY
jgi:glucose-6-phosphate 1-dehydrogenase